MNTVSEADRLRQRMLDFIQQFSAEHGYAPTQREIAAGVDTALSNVTYHLKVLQKRGQIVRKPRANRALAVTPEETALSSSMVFQIQGKPASQSLEIKQTEQTSILLTSRIIPLPTGTWMPRPPRKR